MGSTEMSKQDKNPLNEFKFETDGTRVCISVYRWEDGTRGLEIYRSDGVEDASDIPADVAAKIAGALLPEPTFVSSHVDRDALVELLEDLRDDCLDEIDRARITGAGGDLAVDDFHRSRADRLAKALGLTGDAA